MKKTNTIVCGIAFALPVIYFAVQAFLDKKYLFLILAAVGMIFWIRQVNKIYSNEAAMTEKAQKIWTEKEVDICTALAALLWVSYMCVYDFSHILTIISAYQVFLWIVIWLVLCRLMDTIQNTLIVIHLKAAGALILAFFSGRLFQYTVPAIMSQGFFMIIGAVYLISIKRYLSRDVTERKGLKFSSLYRSAAAVMSAFTIFAGFQQNQLAQIYYTPLAVIKIHWIVPAAIAAAAMMMMINLNNRAERCLAGNLFLLLLYYLVFQAGWTEKFSAMGILCGCLIAGWLAELLDRKGILNGAAGIPVFYLLWLPAAYLLEESVVKGKYPLLVLAAVAVFLIKEAEEGTDSTKTQSVLKVLLILPYLMLIWEYGSRENIELHKLLFVTGITIVILLCFIKLTYPKQNSWTKRIHHKSAVYIVFFCACILIPLLAAARGIQSDQKYPEYFLSADAGELSVGTGMTVNLNGFKESTAVTFDWGDGQIEEVQGNTALATTIKSNHLTITAVDEVGQKHSYHKFWLIWDFHNS